MTRQEFIEKVVSRRIDLITITLASKGKEYSMDENAFHNFDEGKYIAFADSREKYAWDLMTKHLQSMKDIIEHVSIAGANGYPTDAMVEEKIGDAINYLILIEAMLKEQIQNAKTT